MSGNLDDDAYELFAWQLRDATNLAELTTRGLWSLRDEHRLVEKAEPGHRPGAPAVSMTEQEDFLAHREIEDGFPKTWGQSVIALWGHLGVYAYDFAMFIMDRQPERLVKAFEKIKVPLGEYLGATDVERTALLHYYLEKGGSGGERRGGAPFEKIFSALGVPAAPTDKLLLDRLHEWKQVRNLWAHRRGIADERFLSTCSQFGAKWGHVAKVDAERARQYAKAGLLYGAGVYRRVIAPEGPGAQNLEALDSWLAD
jgi:hypothetical protein